VPESPQQEIAAAIGLPGRITRNAVERVAGHGRDLRPVAAFEEPDYAAVSHSHIFTVGMATPRKQGKTPWFWIVQL